MWVWLSLANIACWASIDAEVRALTQRPRSDAPMWVEIQLSSSTVGLREGVLEMEMLAGGRSQYVLRTQELALLGKLKQRFLMPGTSFIGGERELRLHFVEKDRRTDLGLKPLGAVGWSDQSYVIAVAKTVLRTTGDGQPLWVSLKLENLAHSGSAGGLVTSPVYLEPDDFPIDPLGYCAFDIVMIDGGVFSQLREKSVTALGAWLAAGGSVLVTAREKLGLGQARTLSEWAARDPKAEMLRFDSEGKIDAGGKDGIAHFRAGLGRLVVATQVLDEKEALEATGLSQKTVDADSGMTRAKWTTALEVKIAGDYHFRAFGAGSIKILADGKPFMTAENGNAFGSAFGNMRLDAGTHHFEMEVSKDVRSPAFADSRTPGMMYQGPLPVTKRYVPLQMAKVSETAPQAGNRTWHPWLAAACFLWKIDREQSIWAKEYHRPIQLNPDRLHGNAAGFHPDLFQALMPDQIHTIPGMLLVVILVIFVVAVGPLDWWFLGRLRARRWTWLLFPAVAAATTILTVWIARSYMGSAMISRSLIVTDLAADCQVVRETRCDVLLPSHSGEHEASFSRVLAAPMVAGQHRSAYEEEEVSGISFEGQFPASFKMRRGIKQWKPMVTHSTTIGPGEDRSRVKWDGFRLGTPSQGDEIGRKMAEGSNCGVGYATNKDLYQLNDGTLPREALDWIISPRGRTRPSGGMSRSPGCTRRWLELIDLDNDDLNGPVVVFAWRLEDARLHVWRWLYRP
jgi:hypothetical protein